MSISYHIRLGTDPTERSAEVRGALADLCGRLRDPVEPQSVFCAVGAGKGLESLWRGDKCKPHFMLGGLRMTPYCEPPDLFALIHRIIRPYRRRVINAELDPR